MNNNNQPKSGHNLTKESREFILDRELANGIYSKRALTKVIRLKCLDCCCGSADEVKKCTCEKTCFLHPFRFGKNPFRTPMPEEQRELASKRAKEMFGKKTSDEDETDTED